MAEILPSASYLSTRYVTIAFDSLVWREQTAGGLLEDFATHQTTKSLFLWSISVGMRPFGLNWVCSGALCSSFVKSM